MAPRIDWLKTKSGSEERKILAQCVKEYCRRSGDLVSSFYDSIFAAHNDLKNIKKYERFFTGFAGGRVGADKYKPVFEQIEKDYPELAEEIYEKIQAARQDQTLGRIVLPPPERPKSNKRTDVFYVGPIKEAVDQIYDRRKSVRFVWNTHIVSKDDVVYDAGTAEKMNQFFTYVLRENNGGMRDIFGGVEGSRAIEHHERVAREILSLKLEHYRPHILPEASYIFAFINFMILEFGNTQKEVYFGWGGMEGDYSGDVFVTQESGLIELYERAFTVLYDKGVEFL